MTCVTESLGCIHHLHIIAHLFQLLALVRCFMPSPVCTNALVVKCLIPQGPPTSIFSAASFLQFVSYIYSSQVLHIYFITWISCISLSITEVPWKETFCIFYSWLHLQCQPKPVTSYRVNPFLLNRVALGPSVPLAFILWSLLPWANDITQVSVSECQMDTSIFFCRSSVKVINFVQTHWLTTQVFTMCYHSLSLYIVLRFLGFFFKSLIRNYFIQT